MSIIDGFTNCNKSTTLLGVLGIGAIYACVRLIGTWEISVYSAQFCCEHTPALKKK
jgi:hypothetical protein